MKLPRKQLVTPNTRTKDRPIQDRRQGPRTMHVIDQHTTPREAELARADLRNFFLDTLDKHHPGGY